MKKVALAMVVGVIICTLLSCGQAKNLEDVQTSVKNSTMEISDGAGGVQKIQNDDIASSVNIDSIESFKEEEQSITDEVKTDLYEGVYSDYDVNEPSLEIKRNNDGSYQIQIKIYRLFYIDDGMGRATEEGLEFVATGPGGNEVNGVIKVEEDIATVSFFNQEWVDFAGLSEYKFYKTSAL